MAKNYDALADSVVELVGGKDNVRSVVHCITRLRFNLKDKSAVELDEIKKIPGTMGAQWAGDQLQIIIGQDVDKAYDAICKKYAFQQQKTVNENLDAPKKKFTVGACDHWLYCSDYSGHDRMWYAESIASGAVLRRRSVGRWLYL